MVLLQGLTQLLLAAKFGERSIIGSKYLVNKTITPFVVAEGVPVKVIRQRFKNKQKLVNTLQNTNSKYDIDEILNVHRKLGFYYD
ncbi:hypothetical protein [uncultured Winogradskyella sp.]|uniref:hypothetical protein n=1 Tax=uncultured Winogradskyella sp. TaxID=395353 RepID=UPI0030DCBDEA|tara:strand:- start:15704 stop:15958 length:255 start_codon:yes stop_codon:yes gene_type:complete